MVFTAIAMKNLRYSWIYLVDEIIPLRSKSEKGDVYFGFAVLPNINTIMDGTLLQINAMLHGLFSFVLLSSIYWAMQSRGTSKEVMMLYSYLFSTIHSAIVGSMGVTYLLFHGMEEMVGDAKWIWVTVGYLAADELWIVWRWSPGSISIHHFVGGVGLVIIATQGYGHGYGMYFLATEISTVPLNIAWYMRKCDARRQYLVPIYATTLITYFFIRIIPGPWFIYSTIVVFMDNDAGFVRTIAPLIGSIIVTLNVYWFTRLIRSVTKEDTRHVKTN
jgi:hypothetical protein